MHVPDGFLDVKTAGIAAGMAGVGLALALRQTHRVMPRRQIPLMGLSAAFIFAAQMLNFPIVGGTSGHLIGATLAAVLLGPSAAVLVLTAVLIVQCLVFADGGILVLGANIFNMAILGPIVGYGVYRGMARAWPNVFGGLVGVAFGAWCSIVLMALVCGGQLAASGKVAWTVVLPAMAGVHMLIGLVEAGITTAVVYAVWQVRPELRGELRGEGGAGTVAGGVSTGHLVAYGLLAALGLAIFVAPFACSWPDGLDFTAEKLGFANQAQEERVLAAPLPDYQLPGVKSEGLSTALAGAAGTVLAFGFALGLVRVLTRGKTS